MRRRYFIKIIFSFVVYCSLLTANSYSQWITWQKTYGGSHINEGFSMVQLPDGGYFAVGRDRIGQIEKGLLLRLNEYGDTLWTKYTMDDQPAKIIETTNNSYVIVGLWTHIVKIDLNGNILWTSGPYDFDKYFNTIKSTSDGGYIICGRIDFGAISYPYLFKISGTGDSLWEKIYTDSIFDGAFYDMDITLDNNFILIGNVSDSAYITNKLTIMKIDQTGNLVWSKRYDLLRYYETRSIKSTNESSFIVAGSFFYCKFSGTGDLNWLKIYDTTNYVGFRSVSLTNDEGYVFTGARDTIGNFTDYAFLLKTDTSGNELWHKLYGFHDSDRGNEVNQSSDSGYVIIGRRDGFQMGEIYIIKTDKNGFANPPIAIIPISNSIPENYQLSQNYPNPFNPSTNIRFDITESRIVKLVVYDILGKEISTLVNEKLNPGSYEVKFDGTNFASGMYFYSLESGSFRETKKMVLIK